jgi:hypothetical protein
LGAAAAAVAAGGGHAAVLIAGGGGGGGGGCVFDRGCCTRVHARIGLGWKALHVLVRLRVRVRVRVRVRGRVRVRVRMEGTACIGAPDGRAHCSLQLRKLYYEKKDLNAHGSSYHCSLHLVLYFNLLHGSLLWHRVYTFLYSFLLYVTPVYLNCSTRPALY